MLRTVIFIDGENFRNSLRSFSFQSDSSLPRYSLEERHFMWREFFVDVLKKFQESTGYEYQFIRAYWYFARQIVPWRINQRAAQRIVNRNRPRLPELTVPMVIEKAKQWYDMERNYFHKLRDSVFEQIQRDTDFLEFKYVGQYVVRPFVPHRINRSQDGSIRYLGKQQGEKGVDLGIAVDMIAKMDSYDVAILISGDADFLPVVGYLKDKLKYVYQFSLAKGVPPHINYLSPWLRGLVDCFAAFDERELLSGYLDPNARIPRPIMNKIGERIRELERLSTTE